MKKGLLFVILLSLAVATLHAQDGGHKSVMYEIMPHNTGEYRFTIENFMQQHDGDFVYNAFVSLEGPNQWSEIDVGNIFYKVSPTSLTVTDTLFVEDPESPFYFFAPNPIGEGNIRANFEYVEACDSSFLRICHFPDDDLHTNPDDDIVVPVCPGFAWGHFDNGIVDCRGDLIMKYYKSNDQGSFDHYIARFGPEGTLKHQALLYENMNTIIPKLRVYKESPLQYFQWQGYTDQNLVIWTIDSLFHKNPVGIQKTLSVVGLSDTIPEYVEREYLDFNIDTEVIPIDGNDVLVAARYIHDSVKLNSSMTAEYGVAVAKYDLRTMQLKDYIVFNDHPGYEGQARCMGFKKMSDGTVYLLYREVGYPDEKNLIVVKMDTDLNMEWKRFCKIGNISFHWGVPLYFPILCEDGQGEEQGIAWAGYGKKNDEGNYLLYFYLNHEGVVGMDEAGIEVRPYAYWPNPARDELHLQYSPDVTPTQIELHDLQGRMVRSQRNGLESLNLQGLSSGTYTMRVTLAGGKVFSDKVVKN